VRWEDEPWVKLYTRDTLDWDALGWEAQAVWFFVFKKLDTAGILDLGRKGTKGFAAALGMPFDLFGRALATLLEDGCLVLRGNVLVMPNYVEAQQARKSDRQRQRDSRSRARDAALSQKVTEDGGHVTPTQLPSRERDGRHVSTATVPEEKRGEEISRDLSFSLSAPDPDQSNQRAKTGHDWLCYFNARFFQVRGKQRGCASDAKASAVLGDALAAQPEAAIEFTLDGDGDPIAVQVAGAEQALGEAKVAVTEAERGAELAKTRLEHTDAKAAVERGEAEAERLDAIVNRLTKDAPAELAKRSNLIPGLELTPTTITLDGTPLDSRSGKEQMFFAVELAKRMNARSRILIVDDLQDLDPDQQPEFIKMAREGGWQLIGSLVARGDLAVIGLKDEAE
jgi:hypothetical protein